MMSVQGPWSRCTRCRRTHATHTIYPCMICQHGIGHPLCLDCIRALKLLGKDGLIGWPDANPMMIYWSKCPDSILQLPTEYEMAIALIRFDLTVEALRSKPIQG